MRVKSIGIIGAGKHFVEKIFPLISDNRTLKIDEGGYLNSSKVIKMSDQKTLKNKVLKN